MIRRQRQFGSKPPSRKSARAHLAMLLSGCRIEKLASFTAESLDPNVPLEKRRAMLAEVKRARGVE